MSDESMHDMGREASVLLERLQKIVADAEQANHKANSESGFAFNAKQVAEEHAKAIAQAKGQAEADMAQLSAVRKTAEDLSLALAAIRAAAEASSNEVSAMKVQVASDLQSIQGAVTNISSMKGTAEKLFTDITNTAEKASADMGTIGVAKSTVEAATTAIQAAQTQAAELSAKAASDASSAADAEVGAQAALASIKHVVDTSKTTQDRITAYELKLSTLLTETGALHEKVESLLPGATSAGLASAFRDQQTRFRDPQKYWLIVFIATIGLLLIAGLVGLPGFWPGGEAETWDSIGRHLVARLPLVVPLVWLAIYAGRHYTLALRVEEEYAFKEAVSAAFEGYKREMKDIGAANNSSPPIVALCENVLRSLAQRPGRIYEGKHDDITPIGHVAKAAGEMIDAARGGKQG